MICFVALVLQRVMRARLREHPVPDVVSPERALSVLRRIQTHRVVLSGKKKPITGISKIDAQQSAILNSLRVGKPAATDAYTNL